MGLFNWLFGTSASPDPESVMRYEYPTGNVELGMRVERGEFLMAVMADIKPRWTRATSTSGTSTTPNHSSTRQRSCSTWSMHFCSVG